MRRHLVRLALLAGVATLALGPLAVPAGAQSITGGCNVTFNGIDAKTAHSPGTAIEVDEGDTMRVVGTAPGPITGYDTYMVYGPFKYPAKSGVVTGDKTTWTGTVKVGDYTRYGVGIYRVEGASTGTVCSGWAYLKINGPFPLTTVAGGVAGIATVAGVAGMASAARPPKGGRTPGKGRRWRGAFFGLLAGTGAAVLLQQFGAVPMTPMMMFGVPVGTAMVGTAIGWPKAVAAAAAAAV
ncbi:MAG: hypothetical protein WDA60_18925 [Acidimicrobiia bacterium]